MKSTWDTWSTTCALHCTLCINRQILWTNYFTAKYRKNILSSIASHGLVWQHQIQWTYGAQHRTSTKNEAYRNVFPIVIECSMLYLLSKIRCHNWCSASKKLKFTSSHFHIHCFLCIHKWADQSLLWSWVNDFLNHTFM